MLVFLVPPASMTNQPKQFGVLPALRHLGELADVRPTIIVDSREQDPLTFSRLPSERGTLLSGDYSIAGVTELFSIERKSLDDLAGCCCGSSRERFERELHRLRGFRFKRLVIVGSEQQIMAGDYRSNIKPAAVVGTLRAFEIRFDCPLVFCETPEIAAARIESWAFYFARELVCVVNDLWRARPAVEEAAA